MIKEVIIEPTPVYVGQKIKVKIQRRDQVNYSKLKVPKVEINLKLKHERECNVCKLQRNHSCYLNRYFYENEEY